MLQTRAFATALPRAKSRRAQRSCGRGRHARVPSCSRSRLRRVRSPVDVFAARATSRQTICTVQRVGARAETRHELPLLLRAGQGEECDSARLRPRLSRARPTSFGSRFPATPTRRRLRTASPAFNRSGLSCAWRAEETTSTSTSATRSTRTARSAARRSRDSLGKVGEVQARARASCAPGPSCLGRPVQPLGRPRVHQRLLESRARRGHLRRGRQGVPRLLAGLVLARDGALPHRPLGQAPRTLLPRRALVPEREGHAGVRRRPRADRATGRA